MSFLSEVISNAAKMEMEQVKKNLPPLLAKVENLTSKLHSYLDRTYIKFEIRPKKSVDLLSLLSELQQDIDKLQSSAQAARNELQVVDKQNVARLAVTISNFTKLCLFNDGLLEIEQLKEDLCYHACIEKINELKSLLSSIESMELFSPILKEFYFLMTVEENNLVTQLNNAFEDNVKVRATETEASLEIGRQEEEVQLSIILSAMYFYKSSSISCLDKLAQFLFNHIFTPVVNCTTEIHIGQNADNFSSVKLELRIVDDKNKSTYDVVFSRLATIVQFLSTHFKVEIKSENGEDLMSSLTYIGGLIQEKLTRLLITNCLEDTIPSSAEGLGDYNKVIERVKDLEGTLLRSGIFSKDTTPILEYALNVDVLFVNKKCRDYLLKSQEIMKEDLHTMEEVGQVPNNSEQSLDVFPKCYISCNVTRLLDLLEGILKEASMSPEICAGRLICMAQNICRSYPKFVEQHHKELLETIPQQVAVFYNNCAYIQFKLTEYNGKYLGQMPSILNLHSNIFVEDGNQVKQAGSALYSDFVEKQTKQIQEIMDESTGSQMDFRNAEKCLRQCLRQLERLPNVWSNVLPDRLYNQTIGKMLDCLCQILINSTLMDKGKAAGRLVQLRELLKMLQTQCPPLFIDADEISLFVGSWNKVNDLVFILGAQLTDIYNKWADGKGTLGLYLKPEELRQLIENVFPNSEQRALVLSKIKN